MSFVFSALALVSWTVVGLVRLGRCCTQCRARYGRFGRCGVSLDAFGRSRSWMGVVSPQVGRENVRPTKVGCQCVVSTLVRWLGVFRFVGRLPIRPTCRKTPMLCRVVTVCFGPWRLRNGRFEKVWWMEGRGGDDRLGPRWSLGTHPWVGIRPFVRADDWTYAKETGPFGEVGRKMIP